MEEIAQDTIADIVARVAGAIETAAADHGEGAVELALLAYRVDAFTHLFVGLAGVAAFVAIAIYIRRSFAWADKWGAEDKFNDDIFAKFALSLPAAFVGFFATFSAVKLLSAPHWVAAFGYPELLIATKALTAAGLL